MGSWTSERTRLMSTARAQTCLRRLMRLQAYWASTITASHDLTASEHWHAKHYERPGNQGNRTSAMSIRGCWRLSPISVGDCPIEQSTLPQPSCLLTQYPAQRRVETATMRILAHSHHNWLSCMLNHRDNKDSTIGIVYVCVYIYIYICICKYIHIYV